MVDTNNIWQVNIHTDCNDDVWADVTRWSQDGYQGRTIGTRYASGDYDHTDWCVYSGSKEDCTEYASKINNNNSVL